MLQHIANTQICGVATSPVSVKIPKLFKTMQEIRSNLFHRNCKHLPYLPVSCYERAVPVEHLGSVDREPLRAPTGDGYVARAVVAAEACFPNEAEEDLRREPPWLGQEAADHEAATPGVAPVRRPT